MNKRLGFFFAFFAVLIAVTAAPQQLIRLKDQSTIRGEITEMKGGVYTIRSPIMGEIKVPADQILLISNEDSGGVPATPGTSSSPGIIEGNPRHAVPTIHRPDRNVPVGSPTPSPATPGQPAQPQDAASAQEEANRKLQQMMGDGNFVDRIMRLGQSEAMQSVMEDPQIQDAIQRGDYNFLMNNEKINSLMQDTDVKDILGEFDR